MVDWSVSETDGAQLVLHKAFNPQFGTINLPFGFTHCKSKVRSSREDLTA